MGGSVQSLAIRHLNQLIGDSRLEAVVEQATEACLGSLSSPFLQCLVVAMWSLSIRTPGTSNPAIIIKCPKTLLYVRRPLNKAINPKPSSSLPPGPLIQPARKAVVIRQATRFRKFRVHGIVFWIY